MITNNAMAPRAFVMKLIVPYWDIPEITGSKKEKYISKPAQKMPIIINRISLNFISQSIPHIAAYYKMFRKSFIKTLAYV